MIFEPLYSPDLGLVGFRCRCGACTRVVRTQRGAEMHCWRKHKVKVQMEIDYEAEAKQPEPESEPEPVRSERSAERAAEERDVLAGLAKLKPDAAGKY